MKALKLILLLLIITGIIYILSGSKESYISYNKLDTDLLQDLEKYINLFTKNETIFKTKNNIKILNRKVILNFYIKNMLYFSDEEKYIIRIYVKYIDDITKKYKLFYKTPWNFIKISHKLEKSMPFTLNKYIFISDKFLKRAKLSLKNNYKFLGICDTLIHEKIHVIQRIIPNIFNNFYKRELNSIYLPKIELSNYWKKKHIKNTDGLNIICAYFYKGDMYLPLLLFNHKTRNMKQIAIKLYRKNEKYYSTKTYMNINNFAPLTIYPFDVSTYHPNEITADIIPKLILNTSNNRFINNKFNKLLKYI